jgi:hypothetical protein
MEYSINNFLDKFKNLIFQDSITKDIIKKYVKTHTSFELDLNSISHKNGIIFIKGSPILRNEIFLKKKIILENINKEILNIKFLDIK